ncbi:hypothetical protein C4546_00490 [Candidatus Parcubacteria bacterium]|jgi:hypothetical protein|nr:MAG: hypothetical protein C4546_00490 [Candidatus Parcubacteria bacterium]
MLLFLRSLSSLSLIWLVLNYWLAVRLEFWFWLFALLALAGTLAVFWLIAKQAKLKPNLWDLNFFPCVALLGSFSALLFSEKVFFQAIIALGMTLLISLYQENYFRFVFQPARYQTNSLLNLSQVFAALGIFFVAVSLFDFMIFAYLPLWVAGLIFGAFLGLWLVFVLRKFDVPLKIGKVYIFGGIIVGLELFALVGWFPILPIYKAGILMVFLAFLINQIRNESATKPGSRRWASIIYTAVLISLLVTAKWFT